MNILQRLNEILEYLKKNYSDMKYREFVIYDHLFNRKFELITIGFRDDFLFINYNDISIEKNGTEIEIRFCGFENDIEKLNDEYFDEILKILKENNMWCPGCATRIFDPFEWDDAEEKCWDCANRLSLPVFFEYSDGFKKEI